MKTRKTVASLTAGMTLAVSMLQAMPMPAVASGEYLIRDKWGYCTTANYVESEHFVIFYGNNDTTGQVNDAFLQRNLQDYEKLWKCYGEYLGMENMNVDVNGRSQQKYKTNVYLTYTGLDQYPDGWAFMSAEDGYGIEIISPNAMLDDLTTAHEFGHVVTMHQKAWVDQDITGAWWEPLANWFREMYLGSPYYTGNTKTCGFEPYLRNMSLTLPHGRNYYEVWPFLVYLSYNPDNLPGLGMDCVKRIISEAQPNEYPFDTIARLFGTDAQTVFGHYAKRMATFDFGAQEAYQSEFNRIMSQSPFYWNLFYTVLEDNGTGWLQSPPEDSPMQSGINIVPLKITGDTISVDLKGLSDDTNAGWKACIVTVDSNGAETYSDLFGSGESMSISASGAVSAYLTVSAMPADPYAVNAFHKDNVSSYKNGTERRRYPYEIKLSGAEMIKSGGYSKGNGHTHPNGGGWVADGATVADSVYVGPNAMVLGSANLSGNVRVEDYAVVADSVTATDNVVISGHAIVDGGGMIYDNGWKFGSVTLSGNVVIGDSAVVTNSCTVSGNAKILQKAYLAEAVTVSDNAVVKGMSYVYGKGNYSGSAILDGDYSNEQTKNSGVGFGWLDDYGWYSTSDGYVANYDFAEQSSVWSKEISATTDIRQMGAEWSAERTSANGVLNFDGSDDYALVDDALLRSKDLQLSMGVLWKGGSSGQEVFRFGDEKAYMTFTPSNSSGVAELTITDGNTVETLTASAPLAKGEWSKVTVRIINGRGTLLINGAESASANLTLTPIAVMSASETDRAVLGKGFKGAVDYLYFSNKETAEPNVTYTGSEEPDDSQTQEIMWGDANCDGQVKMDDVIKVMAYGANSEKNPLSEQGKVNADVYQNGDGVDTSDALSIQKKVAQLIEELPESYLN
ncbi:MAG: N-acetylglucosamine-1-phosphate uridyltransferase [Ruminococcus sp.]|nr:N-acetylglucosamine-1-phosphate uridyltransferase [Ruminococcus sp.]